MFYTETTPPTLWAEFTRALKREADSLPKTEEGGYETSASVSVSGVKSKAEQRCVVSLTVSRDLSSFPILVHFHDRIPVKGYRGGIPSRSVCQFILEDSSNAKECAQFIIESLHWLRKREHALRIFRYRISRSGLSPKGNAYRSECRTHRNMPTVGADAGSNR